MHTNALFAVTLLLVAGFARGSAGRVEDVASDRQDLVRMFEEDQADRAGDRVDWTTVAGRDQARLAKVKELFAANALRTPGDYYRAAMILQHGSAPEDFLLAHEFCLAAIVLGKTDPAIVWLAAASEDRYLMNIDRPQRFGTQYRSEGAEPLRLYRVDGAITDELRRIMATPTLAEARAREAELNKR